LPEMCHRVSERTKTPQLRRVEARRPHDRHSRSIAHHYALKARNRRWSVEQGASSHYSCLRWRHCDGGILTYSCWRLSMLIRMTYCISSCLPYNMLCITSYLCSPSRLYHHMQQYPRGFLSSSNVTVELLWYIQKLEISLGPLVGVGRSKMIETLL
jgi:hypothetical protein